MSRVLSKEEWRRRKRLRKTLLVMLAVLLMFVIIILSSIIAIDILYHDKDKGAINPGKETISDSLLNGQVIKPEYLTPNPYSRPQKKLERINGVVIHYTANPGTTAENNRDYFEGLATTMTTSASSHFVIGLEGEIIQCIPLTEISYASNDRNDDTISIECCHPDKTGKFNDKTYESLVSLTAALCKAYHLDDKDIIRHYDITKKKCPLYFVEHEDAWAAFKADVTEELERIKQEAEPTAGQIA